MDISVISVKRNENWEWTAECRVDMDDVSVDFDADDEDIITITGVYIAHPLCDVIGADLVKLALSERQQRHLEFAIRPQVKRFREFMDHFQTTEEDRQMDLGIADNKERGLYE